MTTHAYLLSDPELYELSLCARSHLWDYGHRILDNARQIGPPFAAGDQHMEDVFNYLYEEQTLQPFLGYPKVVTWVWPGSRLAVSMRRAQKFAAVVEAAKVRHENLCAEFDVPESEEQLSGHQAAFELLTRCADIDGPSADWFVIIIQND